MKFYFAICLNLLQISNAEHLNEEYEVQENQNVFEVSIKLNLDERHKG